MINTLARQRSPWQVVLWLFLWSLVAGAQYDEGSSETRQDGTSRALQMTATLAVDLGNLPSSTNIFVTTVSTGEVTSFFGRTGLQTLNVTAEALVVRVQDEGTGTSFSREASVDCSTGECRVGPLISELSVDLTGMPIGTDIFIYAAGDPDNVLRSSLNGGAGSSGGQPKSITLLGGSYIVKVVDDGNVIDVAKKHMVNCTDGGSCALNRTTLTAVLIMNLTGLTSTTNVAVYHPSDKTNALRFLSNQGDGSLGGQPKRYRLLQSEYVVDITYNGVIADSVASFNVNCLGAQQNAANSCSHTPESFTTTMTINLTGLPRSTDVRVFVGDQTDETRTGNAGLLREFSDQGDDGTVAGQPKTYTLLPNTYVVEIVDDGIFDQRKRYRMTCLGQQSDVCSLSSDDLTATLTIDFTGLPSTVNLRIFSTQDTINVLRSVTNQGGDDGQPRTYTLLKGEYIVEVILDDSVDFFSRTFKVSCFGAADDLCSISSSDLVTTMTIDFSGLPSQTDLRIFTGSEETMQLLQTFSNVGLGDQPKQYKLLQGNYFVEVIDDGTFAAYSRTFNLTCFGQENDVCSLSQSEISTTMSIDLTGLPLWTDFHVYPSTMGGSTDALRSFSNQGSTSDQPKTLRVLRGDYVVVVVDQGDSFDYSRAFDLTCRGMENEVCSVAASEVSTTMSIDMTGLPFSTSVQIFSALDPNNILHAYADVGGQPKTYTLLQGNYIVEVVEDGYDTTLSNTFKLTCGASCSLASSNITSTLTVDLTGLPFQTKVFIYHTAEPTAILRRLSSQGDDETQPKKYTLLQGEYIVEVVDTSFDNLISNGFSVTCLNFDDDRCVVTNTTLTDTLTVDLTGLPYWTNVIIYRTIDSTTDAFRLHKRQGDSSDNSIQPVSYTLLQGEYVVEIVDDGFDNTYERRYNISCFGGESDLCSVTSSMLTATMTIDLTGLPAMVDVFVYPASDTSAVLRSLGGAGADVTQPLSFTLLQGAYHVEILNWMPNAPVSKRSFNMTCFGEEGDFCSLSSGQVSATMTIDLTGLAVRTHVLIYAASDTENVLRTVFNQGGGSEAGGHPKSHADHVVRNVFNQGGGREAGGHPKSYTVLHGEYVVQVVEAGASTEFTRTFEMTCFGKEDDKCSLSRSELSATMSIDLSGLPQGTDVRISLPSDTGSILRRVNNIGEGSEGGQPKLLTLLQGTYLVSVVDDGVNVELSHEYVLQCLGGASDTCTLSSRDVVTEMTVDMAGLPPGTDLEIYPENKHRLLRRQVAAGGRLMSFSMLRANYNITLIEDGFPSDLRFDLDRTVQCLGQDDDTCAVSNDELVTELSVDLSGLPATAEVLVYQNDLDGVVLQIQDDEGSATRLVRTYMVLKANYRLVIRDDGPEHSYSYVVPRLVQCLGQSDDTCFVLNSEVVVNLSVDLTGQPDATQVQILEAGKEGKGPIRTIENEALRSQPRMYTVLKGEYTVYFVDEQLEVRKVGPLDCTGGQPGDGKCMVTRDEIGGGDTPFSGRRESTSDGWHASFSWAVVAVVVGGVSLLVI